MNLHGLAAIYRFEMARWGRTLWQSLITPVITTALYFVVFGSALGSRMTTMEGVSYGSFIVPGLTLLAVFMQSIFNASFGIYFPKFTGTIYELLSAPISSFEAVLAYVGAAVTKSVILALVTLATALLFVPLRVDHPIAMVLFLIGISTGFCTRPDPADRSASPHQRISLELLLDRRRAGIVERRNDNRAHRHLYGGDLLDVQDGLPT